MLAVFPALCREFLWANFQEDFGETAKGGAVEKSARNG
jgi:hypothetical protein